MRSYACDNHGNRVPALLTHPSMDALCMRLGTMAILVLAAGCESVGQCLLNAQGQLFAGTIFEPAEAAGISRELDDIRTAWTEHYGQLPERTS